MTTHEYWKESDSMSLSQFAEYYQDGGYPQAFKVERIDEGHNLREGQIVIACHERKVRVLQATVLLEDGGTLPVTIPINLAVQFALLPAENSETFWGCPKLSVKDIVLPKGGRHCVPKAVRVIDDCRNSKKQPVTANEVLFNISLGKHGFTGTSAYGVRHTFHEGDTTAQFSSRLGDNKAYPVKFFDHITFPQKARVFFSEGQQCQVEGLNHLCIVEFTGRDEQHFLAIKTNIDDPESHDCQAVPYNLNMLVSAVKLNSYPMDTLTPKNRKMIKHRSTENILQPKGNVYVSKPVNPAIRDEPDPPPLRQPVLPDSRRQSRTSVGHSRSQSSGGDRKSSTIHVEVTYYNLPPKGTEEVTHPQSRRGSKIGVTLYPPGFANSTQVLPICGESPEGYCYVGLDIPTQGQTKGPPPPPPQQAKQKLEQSRSLPPQSSPMLTRPPNKCEEEAYEEMMVQDKPSQKKPVKPGWPPPKPQPTKSSKAPPKGVPSTGIPLPTATLPRSPRVPKKPIAITLTSCPKEPELRFHVAAKLGKDWRSVGTYLGLQYYQLDQADVARSELEDKAMEVLMIWLKKPESLEAPHSWETLLRALRLAGRYDMANHLERDIRNGKLQLSRR